MTSGNASSFRGHCIQRVAWVYSFCIFDDDDDDDADDDDAV